MSSGETEGVSLGLKNPAYLLRNELLNVWRDDQKKTIGRLMTLVDAMFADPEQRKAFKDMVNGIMYGFRMDTELRMIAIDFVREFLPEQAPKDTSGFTGIEDIDPRRNRFTGKAQTK